MEISQLAHEIVAAEEYDFFDTRDRALAHAEHEGIAPELLVQVGYQGATTQVPRRYPNNLRNNIQRSIALLSGHEEQRFLHIDRYGLTVGESMRGSNYDDGLDLIVSPSGRSVSLRLRNCYYGKIDSVEDVVPPADIKNGALELPLGKIYLFSDSTEKEAEEAAYNTTRDWERVLVVGIAAVVLYEDALARQSV